MTTTKRKMHVKRIFGKDADGTKIEDMYADVLRLDEIDFRLTSSGAQDVKARLKWNDAGEEPEGNKRRETETIKITDPQNPPADRDHPDEFIPLELIKRMKVTDSGQELGYRFHNETKDSSGSPVETKRTVEVKRVYFAPVDDESEALLNAGETVEFDRYIRDESSVDKSQYLDVEVIKRSPTLLRAGGQSITGTFKVDELFGPEGLFPQEKAPELNDDGSDPGPPERLDWMQNIINTQLEGDVWALIWVTGTGLSSATQIVAVDWQNNQVGTAVDITTNADILYERNEVITDDPKVFGGPVGSTWHAQIIYGSFQISTANSTYEYKVVDGLTIPLPALFDSASGFYIGPFVDVYNADDPVDMARYAAKLIERTNAGVLIGTTEATITTPTMEAVWLLEWKGDAAKDRRFEISTSGFAAGISVWLYPKRYLKVDKENRKYGAFGLGAEPGTIDETSGRPDTNVYQRVYFPFNWKKDRPPFPKSPGGRDWPWPAGNYMLNPADPTDVINSAMFEIACGFDGADPHWEFKVEKRKHWNADPGSPVDPTLRDRMWQVWPTDVDPPAAVYTRNDWGVAGYTMKPFGEAFDAPDSWQQVETGSGTFDSPPSPLPLIPPETAGF